jgi:hypothetical protein
MTISRALLALARVVIEEAERNPEFARQIEGAIWDSEPPTQRVRAPK